MGAVTLDTNTITRAECSVTPPVPPTPPTVTPTSTPHSSGSSGGTHFGCKDVNALNYEYFSASKPSLCKYATSTAEVTSSTTAEVTATVSDPIIVITPYFPNTGFAPQNIESSSGLYALIKNIWQEIFSQDKKQIDSKQSELGSDLPKVLKIPAINIEANILHLGTDSHRVMESPKLPGDVAWYKLGPKPGEIGNAVIAGHYGWENKIQAVFDNLDKLNIGDKVYVEKENGEKLTFVVYKIRTYSESEIASSVFISSDGESHLNLITCSGSWNNFDQSYTSRLVVFTNIVRD